MDEKVDRRIQRTQKLLQEAMLDLITQKPYSEILIQEITDHGNLSRPAFYLHYRDKDELMLKCTEKIFAELLACPPEKLERPSQVVFEHAAQNPALYRVILGGQAAPGLLQKVRDIITDIQIQNIKQRLPAGVVADRRMEVALTFLVGGLLSLVDWWLARGMKPSVQEITEMAETMAMGVFQTGQGMHPG